MNRLALVAVAALTLSAPAFAGDYRAGGIEVRRPWTRPAQAGMNGVGYLTVTNVGTKPAKLLSVESPAAKSVTIHQSSMANGVSSMRAVTGGLTIAPGATIAFAPGGYHLMLMGLTSAQALGGKVPLTLVFDGGRKLRIDLSVEAGAPKADPMTGMHMDH
ncbi:copper chaperone PCu(A)C [Caulobacter soli]|uniref:copper chaperone PCu(A)C n=1 Tax=Caulobacter soli TaxID=2708539 RepID=UPI0013EA0D89|nr:copper chaperone PCu(A)C [Caulobacter soli]